MTKEKIQHTKEEWDSIFDQLIMPDEEKKEIYDYLKDYGFIKQTAVEEFIEMLLKITPYVTAAYSGKQILTGTHFISPYSGNEFLIKFKEVLQELNLDGIIS